MKRAKVDNKGAAQAAQAQAQATAAATALESNFKADLQNQNIANVIAGGSAADAPLIEGGRKKRQGGGGLASTLGINV